ncbi:MAG TPA: hypothetical protein PKE29_09200 [Phycisphaerales bacterium]|nr:hypothetical protein [Phycisphaerales bacterium]
MMYRGVYGDGVIVPGDGVEFPEGTPITFEPERRPKADRKSDKKQTTRAKKSKRRRMTADERVAAFMPLFGISKDRPEWKGQHRRDRAGASTASGWFVGLRKGCPSWLTFSASTRPC